MFETKARKERHVNDVHYGASKEDCPQCGARVERYYWWDFLPDIFSQVLSSPALCACPYGTFPSQSNVELVRHVRLNCRLLLHTRCSRTDGGFAGVHPPPVWIHQSNQMVTHNKMFWECIQSNICFFPALWCPKHPRQCLDPPGWQLRLRSLSSCWTKMEPELFWPHCSFVRGSTLWNRNPKLYYTSLAGLSLCGCNFSRRWRRELSRAIT